MKAVCQIMDTMHTSKGEQDKKDGGKGNKEREASAKSLSLSGSGSGALRGSRARGGGWPRRAGGGSEDARVAQREARSSEHLRCFG